MNEYAPRQGSVGERALDYLRLNGKTLKGNLAIELDAEASSMDGNLNLCIQHHLISRIVEGGNVFYDVPRPIDVPLGPKVLDSDEVQMLGEALNGDGTNGHAVESISETQLESPIFANPMQVLNQGARSIAPGGFATVDDVSRKVTEQIEHALSGHGSTKAPSAAEKPRNKRQFSVGIFSTGNFELRRGDPDSGDSYDSMMLDREELEILCDFIQKIGSIRT